MEQGYSEVLGKHGSSPTQSHHEHNSHFFPGCYSIFKVELKDKKKKATLHFQRGVKRIKDLFLPVILVHLLRNLIWSQGFHINCTNGIKDFIPSGNIKYFKNCFSQMTYY